MSEDQSPPPPSDQEPTPEQGSTEQELSEQVPQQQPRKKKKKNLLLLESFGISAAIQIGLLVLAGSYVVYDAVIRDDSQFEEAPPTQVEEPPQNVEVQIQKQTPRMNMQQRPLKIKSVGNISVANVTANVIAGAGESFQIASGGIEGMGNLDIGKGAGSLGLGMSEINVFGIKDKGERILFLIDASSGMVYDEMGGLRSYQEIKDEIAKLAGGLAPGALFNVMIFDGGGAVKAFEPQLVSANPDNVEKLKKWLDPINQNRDTVGVRGANTRIRQFTDTEVGRTLARGGNGRMTVTQIALEQNVDLVYIITSAWGGFQRIRREMTKEERDDWRKTSEDPKYREQLREYQIEVAKLRPQVEARKREIDAQRAKNGLPPRVWPGPDQVMAELKIEPKTKHPGGAPNYYIEADDVERYFKDIVKTMYKDKNLQEPKINVIVFMAEDGDLNDNIKRELRDFTRFFRNGRYRELRGLKAIKSHTGG